MSSIEIRAIETKVNDIWYLLDRAQNEEKIARLCGRLDGIKMTLELFGYTITCDEYTGMHKVVEDA